MQTLRKAFKDPKLDIVIPVMGPTGAGKSSFINILSGNQKMAVGHTLTSCTSDIQVSYIEPVPNFEGYRLVIVDTPGFDDTHETDAAILGRIAKWLEKSYRDQNVLGGVIYLHDISCDRFTGTARRNLELFQRLCGDKALKKVVLGTTKWGRTPENIASRHQKELSEEHWKSLIAKGSKVHSFKDSRESAWEVINSILALVQSEVLKDAVLLIQRELGDDRKIIPETEAGKELRYTLQELLASQKNVEKLEGSMAAGGDEEAKAKLLETQQKMTALMGQIKALKIPLSRRFRNFFGLRR